MIRESTEVRLREIIDRKYNLDLGFGFEMAAWPLFFFQCQGSKASQSYDLGRKTR